MPTVAYIAAQQILALIAVCDPSYEIQGWHGALLTMAVVLSAISFNTFAIGKLPVLETLAVILHIAGFFTFFIILWVMGPRAPAQEVFTTFQDQNNWGSLGLATLVGVVRRPSYIHACQNNAESLTGRPNYNLHRSRFSCTSE